jgi:glycosyltransferase involved in cell wall biosynthesis
MLSVIVPAYEEGHHIFRNLLKINDELCKYGIDYEIVLVDDGSTDSTSSEAQKAANISNKIKVITSDKNVGKGNAIRLGFKHSSKDLITFIDGDLDIPPTQIKPLLDAMSESGADVVIQSKRHPESVVNGFPLNRRILSRSYSYLIKFLYRLPVSDTQVGIKLYRREVLDKILPKVLVKRYAFDVEQLLLAHKYKFKIVECPVTIDFDPLGDNMKLKDIFHIAWDTAAIYYRLNILKYYNMGDSVSRRVHDGDYLIYAED